jgi:hypothetical protein
LVFNTSQSRGLSWSYGSWIYNYLCNQCLSPLKLWVLNPVHGKVYLIQPYVIKFISDLWRRWFSSGTLVFLQQNWPPRYNWNIVEIDVKHHKTKSNQSIIYLNSDINWLYRCTLYVNLHTIQSHSGHYIQIEHHNLQFRIKLTFQILIHWP